MKVKRVLFSVLFGYFATLPKDAALVQNRCSYKSSAHFIMGIRGGSLEFIPSSYQRHNYIQNVCLFQHTKKEEKMIIALFWLEACSPKNIIKVIIFSIRRAWMHVVLNKTLLSGGSVILRVVLLKFDVTSWLRDDVIVEFCHWPCVCTKGLLPQTAGSNHNNPLSCDFSRPRLRCHLIGSVLNRLNAGFVARFRSVLDWWMDLTLAMTHTYSLTYNRASLLTILMFSTGFLVCSCNVLYPVANTFFPISFRWPESTCYVCVLTVTGFSRDSVRKHTVALTKKKQCCTDQYIWWSLCVYSIHLYKRQRKWKKTVFIFLYSFRICNTILKWSIIEMFSLLKKVYRFPIAKFPFTWPDYLFVFVLSFKFCADFLFFSFFTRRCGSKEKSFIFNTASVICCCRKEKK